MSIGDRVKARRTELGLSQRELAARLGYNDHTTLTNHHVDDTRHKISIRKDPGSLEPPGFSHPWVFSCWVPK